MKSRLCIFVLSLIPSTNSRADDYSASVDALKRNQAELNQMISPYKTLAGFKSPEILSGSSDQETSSSGVYQWVGPSVQFSKPTGGMFSRMSGGWDTVAQGDSFFKL